MAGKKSPKGPTRGTRGRRKPLGELPPKASRSAGAKGGGINRIVVTDGKIGAKITS